MISKIILKGYIMNQAIMFGMTSNMFFFSCPFIIWSMAKLIQALTPLVYVLVSSYVIIKRVNDETKEKRPYTCKDD